MLLFDATGNKQQSKGHNYNNKIKNQTESGVQI